MKTDEDKSLVAERPDGNSRQRRVPCHGRCRGGMGNVRRMPPRMGPAQRAPRLKGYATGRLGGVVCRRESEGFYHGGGGFSDSGRKVLIPGVMVAIVNIST